MSSVSIYCPTENKEGKTCAVSLSNNNKPFFLFNLKSASKSSKDYTNAHSVSDKELSGIITDIEIDKYENISITPTIGSDLFLYVGGENPWDIRISGFAFDTCDSKTNGFNNITKWYADENVSKTGQFCELQIGTQIFRGYLYRYQIIAITKEAANLFRFRMSFYAIRTTT